MRTAIHIVLVLTAFVLQTAVFPFISPFGPKPDILLIAVVCAAAFSGALEGAITGAAVGIALDMMYMSFVGYYAMPYLLAGAAAGLLYRRLLMGRVVFPVAACALLTFIKETFDIVIVYFMRVDINWPAAFLKILIISAFTAAVALPVFQGFYALDKLKLLNRNRTNLFGDKL